MKVNYNRNIYIYYLNGFLNEFIIWIPFLVLFATRDVGLSYSQYMSTEIIFSIACFILELPTGIISDMVSRKLSWILGNLFLLLGALLMTQLDSYSILLVTQLIWALYSSLHSGSNEALIYDSLQATNQTDKFTKVISTNQVITNVSRILAGLLSIYVLRFVDIKFTFYTYPPIVLLSFLISFLLKEPKNITEKKETKIFVQIKDALRIIVKTPKLISLIVFAALVPALTKTVFWFTTPLLQNFEINEEIWGLIAAFKWTGSIIVLALVPILAKRLHIKTLTYITSGLIIFFCFLLFSNNPSVAILSLIIIVNTRYFVNTIFAHKVNDLLPSDKRATILSLENLLFRLIFSVGSYASTFVFDNYGMQASQLSIIFIFVIPISIVTLIITKNSNLIRKKSV